LSLVAAVELLERRQLLSGIMVGYDTFQLQQPSQAAPPVVLDVLANDYGMAGGLTISSTASPAHGSVSIERADPNNPGGHDRLSLLLDPTFAGTDSFTYTVADADGDQATATVTLTINGGTAFPIGGYLSPAMTNIDTSVGQDFSGNIFGSGSSASSSATGVASTGMSMSTGSTLPSLDPSTLWPIGSPESMSTVAVGGTGFSSGPQPSTGVPSSVDPLTMMNGDTNGGSLLLSAGGSISLPTSTNPALVTADSSPGSATTGIANPAGLPSSILTTVQSTGTVDGAGMSMGSPDNTPLMLAMMSGAGGAGGTGANQAGANGAGVTAPLGTTGGDGGPQTDAEKEAARENFLDAAKIATKEQEAKAAALKISQDWQDKLNSAQASLSADIQKLIDDELADRKATKLGNLDKAKQSAKNQADANQAVEDKFNSQQKAAQDELKSKTDKADADFNAAKDAANTLHQQTVDAAQSKFDSTTASANAEFATEVDTANSDYATGMAAIDSSWSSALADAESTYAATEGASATAFESAMAAAGTSYDAMQSAAKSAWDAIQAAYSNVTIDWNLIGADSTFVTDRDAANSAFDTELDRISNDLQSKVATATGNYSTSMNNAKTEFDGKLNGANTKYDEQSAGAVTAYNNAVNLASKTFNDGVTTERTDLNAALTKAESNHSKAISDGDKAYSDAVSDAESAYNTAVDKAKDAYRKFLVTTYGDENSAGSLVESRWGLEAGFLESLFHAADAYTQSIKNLNAPINVEVVAGISSYDTTVRGAVADARAEAMKSFKTYQDAVAARKETYRAAEKALQLAMEGMTPVEYMMAGMQYQTQVNELKRAFLVGLADDEVKFVTDVEMQNAALVTAERGAAKTWVDKVADTEYDSRNTYITATADRQKAQNLAGATFVKGLASQDIATQQATQAKLADLEDAIAKASETRQKSLATAQKEHTEALATAETNYAADAKLAIDAYVTNANGLWKDLEADIQKADADVVDALTKAANTWTTTVTAAQTKLTQDQSKAYETLTNSVWTEYMASVGESITANEARTSAISTAAVAAAHRVYSDPDSWAVVDGALAYTNSISSAYDTAITSMIGAAGGYVTSVTSAAASHDNSITSAAEAAANGQQSLESSKSAALHNANEKKERTLADAKQALDSSLLKAELAKEASLTRAAATQATARAAAAKRFADDDAAARCEAVIDQNAAARREFKALTTDQIAEFNQLVDAKLKSANTLVDKKASTDRPLAKDYRDAVKAAAKQGVADSAVVTSKRAAAAVQEIRDRKARLDDPVGRPSQSFSGFDVASFNVDADGPMRAACLGQQQLDWLDRVLPPLRSNAPNDMMMQMYHRDEFIAPLNIARSHLQLLAGAPDAIDPPRLNAYQFSSAPADAMQLNLGDLRKQWNITKQPSWSDLLDDPDLKDQLLAELTNALGDRAAKFLEQQGAATAKPVLQDAVAGWKFSFASLTQSFTDEYGTHTWAGPDFVVDTVARTITINTSRNADNVGVRAATDSEINAAIAAAANSPQTTTHGTGITPLDSVAAAAFDAFVSHPNAGNTLRLATAALQIGGGIVAILAPDPTLATKVIGTYSIGVGTDEALAAITGLISGEHVRSSREQGVDYFTQDQQLTDKILFVTDLGIDGFDAYQTSRAWMKNRDVFHGGPTFNTQPPPFDVNRIQEFGRLTPDRMENCLNSAIAMDSSLNGRLASALPTNGVNTLSDLKRYTEAPGMRMRGFSQIEKQMAELGPGATGIIAGQRRTAMGFSRPGHMFNVFVDEAGVVRFVDGQGTPILNGYSEITLFITNTP
jgi:hypothetical protein